MSAFDTILVAVDHSGVDEMTIPVAQDEACRHGAPLVLMYVAERPENCHHHSEVGGPCPVSDFTLDADTCVECRDARAYLADLERKFHLLPAVEHIVVFGDPVRQLEREARKHGRTLLVLANIPGETDEQQLRNERLLRRGTCNLMMVVEAPAENIMFEQEVVEFIEHYTGLPI